MRPTFLLSGKCPDSHFVDGHVIRVMAAVHPGTKAIQDFLKGCRRVVQCEA